MSLWVYGSMSLAHYNRKEVAAFFLLIKISLANSGLLFGRGWKTPPIGSEILLLPIVGSGDFIITDRRDFPVPLDEFAKSIFTKWDIQPQFQ